MHNNFLEKLAELEHQQWQNWAKKAIEKGSVPESIKTRWSEYFIPYAQLDEKTKELDREYARKILTLFEQYIKENN